MKIYYKLIQDLLKFYLFLKNTFYFISKITIKNIKSSKIYCFEKINL